MDRMFRQVEYAIAAMRELLHAHDGSAIQTMGHSVKSGYRSLKKTVLHHEAIKQDQEETIHCLDKLEQSLIRGDSRASERILDRLEAVVRRFQTGESPFYKQMRRQQ